MYFTVPGPIAARGSAPPSTPFVPAVYYIAPGSGKAVKAVDGITNPNGVQLSPDEKTLYVNDTRGEYLIAMDVHPDGTLGPKRNFAKYEGVENTATGPASGADGLAVDSNGRVYAATADRSAGVQPEGRAPGHDSAVTLAAEPGVCGSRQEDALHRRPQRRVEGSDARAGIQGPREVANERADCALPMVRGAQT